MANELAQHPLNIPERTLKTLSFCEPTPRHLAYWLDNLPMANLGDASRHLYHAIIELNKLQIEADIRVRLLELLYEPVTKLILNLKRHYLKQPVLLPTNAQKVVRLTNALNFHLAVGYKVAIQEMSGADYEVPRKVKKAAATCLHRGISILSEVVLRSCELYMETPSKTWQEIHQLYQIAESNDLQTYTVDDATNRYIKQSTIADTYKKTLMLSCCRPNQMRQKDIGEVYQTLELWTGFVQIGPQNKNSRFFINLGSDSPPLYAELAEADQKTPFYRWLDFSPLLSAFKAREVESHLHQGAFIKGVTVPESISPSLLEFLTSAWNGKKNRTFKRVPNGRNIQLSVGFSNAHYFLSGGVEFEEQLSRTAEENRKIKNYLHHGDEESTKSRFQAGSKDIWDGAFDAERQSSERLPVEDMIHYGQATDSEGLSSHYNRCEARLVNSSPNGYCVIWKEDLPDGISAGQIIGINESNTNNWSLGVIRWINRSSKDEVTIGLEILSVNAVPCGAKVVTKEKRKSDYMRAFLLPGNSAADQSASLITPNLPFKADSKVILNQYGEVSQGKISEVINTTSSFTHFVYLADMARDIHSESEENIEDIWPDI